jgi:hypothetical protein
MRSILSLITFAIGAWCFVVFVTKVKPAVLIAAPAPSEQPACRGALGASMCP